MKKLFVIAAAVCIATQSFAGTVFDTVTTEADGTKSTGTISAQDGNLRIEMNDGSDDATMIYKQDLQGMMIVNHAEKNYMVVDKAMVDSISQQMAEVRKQMEETLKGVPPEQRAMVEKMMSGQMSQLGGGARPAINVVEMGDGGKINGVSTSHYRVTNNGKTKQNLWMADWSELDGSEDLKEGLMSMVDLMSSFMDAMPMVAANMENPFEALSQIDGYPVRTEQLDGQGRVESTTDLVSSEAKDLADDVFDPPAGYSKQEMPSLGR